jgi:hypothetical protein
LILGDPRTGCCYWHPDPKKERGEDAEPGM